MDLRQRNAIRSNLPFEPARRIVYGLWLVLVLVSCQRMAPTVESSTQLPGLLSPDWREVYFTRPDEPAARSLRVGPDAELAAAIDRARLSVDIAAMNLDLWSLRNALIAAHRRGVVVRMVTESDYLDTPEIEQIQQAGIPVLGDRREGLMHNKFVIIDRLEVWTGSMNYTVNGVYRNDNNLLRVRSSRLAKNYTVEFEEMFVEDHFGPASLRNTPYPELSIDGQRLEVYFSPEDGTETRLVELIQNARQSVRFMLYSFTADELATVLIDRSRTGVSVAGVVERRQVASNIGTEYERLRAAGIDVRLDGNPDNMHHKVLVIDEAIVVTGSYNFSRNAATVNDENTLILFDPPLAEQYLAEFERLYQAAAQE